MGFQAGIDQLLLFMREKNLNINPAYQNGYNILTRNQDMLEMNDGQVIIHSTVGRGLQFLNKQTICQQTQAVEELLRKFYSTEDNPPKIIRSVNINNMNCPSSGGSKSRRRKTHNKHASRSKSKTQRRRRARMSRR
jgi:hypothetical protein